MKRNTNGETVAYVRYLVSNEAENFQLPSPNYAITRPLPPPSVENFAGLIDPSVSLPPSLRSEEKERRERLLLELRLNSIDVGKKRIITSFLSSRSK